MAIYCTFSSSLNMHAARTLKRACAVAVYFLDATKIRVVCDKSSI